MDSKDLIDFEHLAYYLNLVGRDAQTNHQLRRITIDSPRFQKRRIPLIPWLEVHVTSLSNR